MGPLDDLFTLEPDGELPPLTTPVRQTLGVSIINAKALEKQAVSLDPLSPFKSPLGKPVTEEVTEALKPPSEESIRLETLGELFDPSHEQEMARIRTRAMLSEFMSDDPIISTYDPEEVSSAYNQVVQLAPRTAAQPAVMRGLLRKLLQQQDALETFDADQITQIEERLKKLSEPPQQLVAPYRKVVTEGGGK